MPIIAAIVTGASVLGASLIGGSASNQNVDATNASNANLNAQNMAFQQNMSNTAMVRRRYDLENAGFNPLLAVSQGGASTPGFSPIAMQANTVGPQIMAQAGQAGPSAMAAYQNAKNTQAGVSTQQTQQDVNAAQAKLLSVQADKLAGVDTAKTQQDIEESKAKQTLMQVQQDATAAQASLSQAQVRVADQTLNEIAARIRNIGSQTSVNEAQQLATEAAAAMTRLNIMQQRYLFPEIAAQAKQTTMLQGNQLAESEAMSKFWSTFGAASPTLKALVPILEMLLKKPANVTVLGK